MANRTIARAGNAPRLGKMGRSRLARAVALGILLGGAGAVAPAVQAAESVWTGATSDRWTEIGNWVVPPTSGSFVIIDAIAPNATSLDTVVGVGAMIVGDHAQGALTIGAGGELSVLGSQAGPPPYGAPLGLVLANAPGSQGAVRVDGAGARLVAVENTLVGNGGTGTLSIINGGTAELGLNDRYAETLVGFGYYGWGDSSAGVGHVTVDGAGSILTYAGGINVLNGSVDVTGGGQLVSIRRAVDGTTFWVDGIGFGLPPSGDGSFPGLVGDATVSIGGAGSAWNSANALNVGTGGPATLEVTDGGTASFKGYTVLGAQARLFNLDGSPTNLLSTGNGALEVSGAGSSFTVAADPDGGNGSLRVGYTGTGSARVESGASASIAGMLVVGDRAAGTLDLASGGTMTVAGSDANGMGLAVGNVAGSTGAVTVSGAGSTLVVDAGAQVGNSGTGSLAVLGGAHASVGLTHAFSEIVAGFGYYGWGVDTAQGRGSITVDGAGSLLEYGGGLNLLNGDMTIANGGKVASILRGTEGGWIDMIGFGVPADPDPDHHFSGLYGDAQVVVSGTGSAWESINGLWIGSGGDGLLQVLDGGKAGFTGFVDLGLASRLYDSIGGSPVPGVAPQSGAGYILVSGAGSKFSLSVAPGAPTWGMGVMRIGFDGDGGLGVADGGIATIAGGIEVGGSGIVLIGGADPATGDLTLVAAGTLDTPSIALLDPWSSLRLHHASTDATLAAAISGTGYIEASAGSTRLTGDSSAFAGATGIDGGATLAVSGKLSGAMPYVGEDGAGTLLVDGGGAVHVTRTADFGTTGFTLGLHEGSNGAATITGTGSSLTVDAGTQVGGAGAGVLTVKDGGVVNAGLGTGFSETLLGFGNYGWATGAEHGKGTMTVSGAGSAFNYAGGLNVLNGAATVSAGGKIASQKRAVDGTAFWTDVLGFGVPANSDGSYPGLAGTGTMTVTGAGSSWSSVNGLNIGYGSAGSLSVLDGAQVGFTAYAELGKLSYLYDAPDGAPVPGLAGRAGTGTLLVSGAGSSFALAALAGNTTWGTGVLELGSEGKGSVTVNNGATLSAAGGILVGAQGTFTVGGMQGGALAAPGTVASGITLVDPAATLVFNHSATAHDDTAYAFAPVISGNGHVDVAGGFTRLTGDSSAFAGDTTIDTGATLSVNGSLGGDISVDGRLQGTGTVGNVTVNDGGTLAPGNSPGTLHVDGDLVMQTGSTYAAEIDSDTGAADSIAVAGNVTIEAGTVLSVSNLGTAPLTPGADIQLIQTSGATSTVEGQFDTVVGGSELLDFGVSYENGQIQVSAERSETTNFASVAGEGFGSLGVALDGIPDDNALTKLVFTQVTTAAAAAALMDDMAGTMHADLRRVMLEESRYPRAAIGERLQDDDASGGVAWARATGGSTSNDGAGGLPGATVDHGGVMVGYDAAVGSSRLGIAIGTDKGSYSTDGRDASATLYGRHVSLYGRSLLGGLRLGYGVAFGATDAKTSRAFDIGSARQHLESKHEARTSQGFVDLGYRLDGGNSFRYIEPFLNLARVQVDDDATTEEGSVAALRIASGDTSATLGTIGLRWSADMGDADFAGSIGWRHAFGFDGASATQAFVAGGPSFTIDSLPIANAVVVDLGARFRMAEHARVWLGYNGMLSGSAHDHGLKLQFNLDL